MCVGGNRRRSSTSADHDLIQCSVNGSDRLIQFGLLPKEETVYKVSEYTVAELRQRWLAKWVYSGQRCRHLLGVVLARVATLGPDDALKMTYDQHGLPVFATPPADHRVLVPEGAGSRTGSNAAVSAGLPAAKPTRSDQGGTRPHGLTCGGCSEHQPASKFRGDQRKKGEGRARCFGCLNEANGRPRAWKPPRRNPKP